MPFDHSTKIDKNENEKYFKYIFFRHLYELIFISDIVDYLDSDNYA